MFSFRHALVALLGIAFVAGLTVYFAYVASQQVPEFYQQALSRDSERSADAGEQLERDVLELHNHVQNRGEWEQVFTEESVNGWLAVDLPTKFSDALPKGISEPRVAIGENKIRVACKYSGKNLSSVISLDLEVALTQEDNVILIRIDAARAGLLPIPLKNFLADITKVAEDAEITVRWTDEGGDPVALLTIPEVYEGYEKRLVRIDGIEVVKGMIRVIGKTKELSESDKVTIQRMTNTEIVGVATP